LPGARMSADRPAYKPSALQLVMERVGWGLRERYRIPKELPPILLTLVGKLDAFEGYLLLRKRQRTHSGTICELFSLWSFDPLA
jgi:hypothetical protein